MHEDCTKVTTNSRMHTYGQAILENPGMLASRSHQLPLQSLTQETHLVENNIFNANPLVVRSAAKVNISLSRASKTARGISHGVVEQIMESGDEHNSRTRTRTQAQLRHGTDSLKSRRSVVCCLLNSENAYSRGVLRHRDKLNAEALAPA